MVAHLRFAVTGLSNAVVDGELAVEISRLDVVGGVPGDGQRQTHVEFRRVVAEQRWEEIVVLLFLIDGQRRSPSSVRSSRPSPRSRSSVPPS